MPGLMRNEKHRSFSLFGSNLENNDDYFGNVYSVTYKGTFANLAQAHRHRTLDYQMERLEEKEYYIPPIIRGNEVLVKEWLKDMELVQEFIPQGELIRITETGKYEDFILKCKERLCSGAQLEIAQQTKELLTKYQGALEEKNHPLASDIEKYTHGARCTFPDFDCTADCKLAEGKKLLRRI